jgi:ABC-type polysaccharide/polyol phosphate transport system ATPase subunit
VSNRPPAVFVDAVSKTFVLPHERVHTLKERALHPLRRGTHDTLHALRDVSLAVEPGEFFGIVGRNGSGKSTLLKCLAGIYATDAGRIYVNGRMSTFIELGVGFNPDLPARENVMINATMLGLTSREARRRFDRIIDFAELHDFVDLKLKNYSSGMLVRLAFSVMIQVDAEILLIDEVLAVGDAAFQQKCFEEFARIRRSGATVLLVTHDMGAVQRFCDRAMLLEHGRRVELGQPERVGMRYMQLSFDAGARAEEEAEAQAEQAAQAQHEGAEAGAEQARVVAQAAEPTAEEELELRLGDGRAEIVESWFEDEDGKRATVLQTGRPCTFRSLVRFNGRLEDPLFGVNLHNSGDDHVWGASNLYAPPSGVFEAGDEIVFEIAFRNLLAPDRYFATPAVADSAGGLAWHDRRNRFASVMVTGSRPGDGLLELPFELRVERGGAARGARAADRPEQPAAEETAR